MSTVKRYVFIGDGAAGMTAAQTARLRDPDATITIVSDDPQPAYFRASLTNYLMGELREEHLWAVPPTVYSEGRIDRQHTRVQSVDTARNQLVLQGGMLLPYDALMIGSGSRARPPTFPGADLPGIGVLRTLKDVRWAMDLIQLHSLRRAIVIGGGPLALEWAFAMKERGVAVTVMVRDTVLMAGSLDAVASDLLIARIRRAGIDLRLGDQVESAAPGPNGHVGSIRTKLGHTIPCELVAAGIGVICNTEFLANSGIAVGKKGGVIVDDFMRSNVPNVYAGGDVVEYKGQLDQKWEPARVQGRIAGANMTGAQERYAPGLPYFATRLYDLDYSSVGIVVSPDATHEEIIDRPKGTGQIVYKKVILKDGKLKGALLFGERAARVRLRGRLFQRVMEAGLDVSSIKAELLDPAFDLNGWIKSKELVEKPVQAAANVPSAAQIRGTQAINVADLLKAGSAGATVAGAAIRGTQSINLAAALAAQAAAQPPVQMRTGQVQAPLGPTTAQAVPAAAPGAMLSIGFRIPDRAVATPTMSALAPTWLEGGGRKWELGAPVSSLGRDPAGLVLLDGADVSFVHAQITRHRDQLFLRDLGSRTGTFVNGKGITLPHLLKDGDQIRIGAATLLFRTLQPAAAPQATYARQPVPVAPAGPPRQGLLVGRAGSVTGATIVLKGPTMTIGRDAANAINLPELNVSRRHAALNLYGATWNICDLQSNSGTFRNGERLPPGRDVPLNDGDQIQLGDAVVTFTSRPIG